MRRPDLAGVAVLGDQRLGVICGHVMLELLRVGAGWWFPSGDLFGLVEIVRQVLAVAVAHLPAGGETSLGLLALLGRRRHVLISDGVPDLERAGRARGLNGYISRGGRSC